MEERLTGESEGFGCPHSDDCCSDVPCKQCITYIRYYRLREYEDTGLSPKEVEELKSKNKLTETKR